MYYFEHSNLENRVNSFVSENKGVYTTQEIWKFFVDETMDTLVITRVMPILHAKRNVKIDGNYIIIK